MNPAATSWGYWRHVRARQGTGTAYAIYLIAMVGLVTLGPLVRGAWLLVTDRELAASVVTLTAEPLVPVIVLAVWAATLITGSFRGPVVLPPFLTHVLAGSAIAQRNAFRRQLWMPVLTLGIGGMLTAFVICRATDTVNGVDAMFTLFTLAMGTGCGVIAAVLWLAGQALPPRVVGSVAAALVIVAVVIGVVPMPGTPGPEAPVAVSVAAIALATSIRPLAGRLDPRAVIAQSSRWERATIHAGTLDLSGSADTYRQLPHANRRRSAIFRARKLHQIIFWRDAVAATRTPSRLAISGGLLVTGGALLAVVASTTPAALSAATAIAAVAGVLIYVAAGAVTDGLRHIVESVGTLPLYGSSDVRLLLAHVSFPLLTLVAALAIGVMLAAVFGSATIGPALLAATVTAAGVVALRVMSALKPSLPIALLAPIPTPAGDISALARVAWALDSVLFAAAIGITASLAATMPSLALVCGGLIAGVIVHRWRQR